MQMGGGGMGGGGMEGDAGEGEPPPPPPTPAQNLNSAMDQDPLLAAAKGVFGFGKSLFGKVTGAEKPPDGSTDSQKNDFYYDEVKKRWCQRGMEEPNADDYDPMTGKLKPKICTTPPPMGIPGRPRVGAASLYPGAPPPSPGGMG